MGFVKTLWSDRALPALTGAQQNRIESGLDDLYNKVAFKVYRNAAFNITDTAQLQFDTAEYDPDGLYKLAGADIYRFVAPKAGLWEFTAQYWVNGSPGAVDTFWAIRWQKNGGSGGPNYEGPRTPNRGYPLIVAATLYVALAAGDTIEAKVTIGAAVAATAVVTGPGTTWMGGHLVRAT